MLEELYQEVILDHYRRPRNKGKLEDPDFVLRETNPLCGDEIEIAMQINDGKIKRIMFDGHGCSISQASASIMTNKLEGKTIAEAETLVHEFFKMMRSESSDTRSVLGDAKAFQGVLKFPVRVKCATLAWHTAQNGLETLGTRQA